MATSSRLKFTNARVVTPDRIVDGGLTASDGVIEDVGPTTGGIDCGGDFLIPGFVEIHTDNVERCLTPRNSAFWPAVDAVLAHDAQLAAAGVTTALNALMVGALWTSPSRPEMIEPVMTAIDAINDGDTLKVDHKLHLRVETSSADAADALEPWLRRPDVALVSIMDHSPGQRQFRDLDRMADFLLAEHGVEEDEIPDWAERMRAAAAATAPGVRRAAAAMTSAANVRLASHDDETADHIAEARTLGATIAEFPTTLDAAEAARAAGMTIVCGAPNIVRGESLVGNISAQTLAEHDLLDALSSDYAPHSLLQAVFRLGGEDAIALPKAVGYATERTARSVGLDDRGRLAPGLRADILRVRRLANGAPALRGVWRVGERVA